LPGVVQLGQVTYAINVFQVRTVHEDHAVTGSELTVRRLNHTIDHRM